MTGGQPIDGQLTVQQITHQLYGEGVHRIAVVSDEPDKYPSRSEFADGVTFHHRDDLQAVQIELREIPGCTAMVYDQTCAAEKRRRRKRSEMTDPQKRVVINPEICEGCGDCGVQSNCLSLLPKETDRGRKRDIDQSACNKDFSCIRGFCPSFVTVKGGKLRKPAPLGKTSQFPELPLPQLPGCATPYNILLTGVGGTGVVTVSALLGMAAHIEGKGAGVLDQIGLAQKFGAVMSHIRIAETQEQIHTVRIPAGETDLMIGFDLMVGASEEALGKLDRQRSQVVINNHETMPAAFTRDPDLQVPTAEMEQVIRDTAKPQSSFCLDATALATNLLGDGMAVNLFCIGYAWQKGLIPLEMESIGQAIELNGVAVDANKQAFLWGRRAAHSLQQVEQIITPASDIQPVRLMPGLDEVIHREMTHLEQYQGAALAKRYQTLVNKVAEREKALGRGIALSLAVAENYGKVLAYKDEYEVARQLTSVGFRQQLENQFEGEFELEFNLAPPLISRINSATGRPVKRRYSEKIMPLFRLLARLRTLRGTPLDLFGYSADRRLERRLIREYEQDIQAILENLSRENLPDATELARLPSVIRGYGPVKEIAYAKAQTQRQQLLERLLEPESAPSQATV